MLSLNKASVASYFMKGSAIASEKAFELHNDFLNYGTFKALELVEIDQKMVQALPVAQIY